MTSWPSFFSRRTSSACPPHHTLAEDAQDGRVPLLLFGVHKIADCAYLCSAAVNVCISRCKLVGAVDGQRYFSIV